MSNRRMVNFDELRQKLFDKLKKKMPLKYQDEKGFPKFAKDAFDEKLERINNNGSV